MEVCGFRNLNTADTEEHGGALLNQSISKFE